MFCSSCNADLIKNHLLEDHIIPAMTNKSRIIYPKCSICGHPIQFSDVSENISENTKILLITGTAGAGKTAIGQLIESRHDYIFIDGDAIQKKVNYFAKRDPGFKIDSQTETMNTALVLMALGYNVVVGYIINEKTLKMYLNELARHKVSPVFRVLVPERNVCLERDNARECWTAGEKWVDQWYDEMRLYLTTHESLCIDSSKETLEETYKNHFADLL
ncbi:MAG: nucleoside/nucleotide kinase family protein [Saccharofermentanales bacterium]